MIGWLCTREQISRQVENRLYFQGGAYFPDSLASVEKGAYFQDYSTVFVNCDKPLDHSPIRQTFELGKFISTAGKTIINLVKL